MWLVCAVNGSCLCCVRARVHAPCVSVVMCFYAWARVCVCALLLLYWRKIFPGWNDRALHYYTKYSPDHSPSTASYKCFVASRVVLDVK